MLARVADFALLLEVVGAERPSGQAKPAPPAWLGHLLSEDGPGILRLLWRLLGREQDVMDAYQDCFCRLASLGDDFPVRNARAYAYRTASNLAVEMIRARQRREAHRTPIATLHRQQQSMNHAPLDDNAELETLPDAVAALPAHLRNVVVLRDLCKLPYEEVASIMKIDPATARVYRRHAVVKLAEALRPGDLT